MKRNSKNILALLLAIFLLLALCSCEKNPEPPSNDKVRSDVVYCLPSDIGGIDHIFSTDQTNNILYRQLYDRLIVKDRNGNFEGRLAKSWEISDDGLTYTFHLRDDVICHDGQKMTAADVAYSINREIASPSVGPQMKIMIDCTEVDPLTVEIHLSAPFSPTLDVLEAWGFISSARTTDYEKAPIGTGPYKYDSRKSGYSMTLKAWDQYYRGEAKIKTLTIRILTDPNTQLSALQSGEIDFLTHSPLSIKNAVESDPNLVWHETIFRGNTWVSMNEKVPPFDDILARKAVQYGLDKNTMLAGGSDGLGKNLKTLWPENITASPEADYVVPYTYDLEKARDYLQQYKDKVGKDDIPVEIIAPDTPMYLNPALTLEGLLRDIGFTATTNQIARPTWSAALLAYEYQITVAGTSWPVSDGDCQYMYLHSSCIGGQNYFPCNNAEIDEKFDFARASTDVEQRRAAYKRIQEIVDEEAIVLTLYRPVNAVAFNKNLKGVDMENDLYQHFVYDWHW